MPAVGALAEGSRPFRLDSTTFLAEGGGGVQGISHERHMYVERLMTFIGNSLNTAPPPPREKTRAVKPKRS